MTKVIQYISWFMAVAGLVTFIWQKAIITEQRKEKALRLEQKVSDIESLMITEEDIAQVVDSVLIVRLAPVVKAQNNLRDSYVLHLKDASVSVDKYIQYLNGIEFELKYPIGDTVRIKIRKKK